MYDDGEDDLGEVIYFDLKLEVVKLACGDGYKMAGEECDDGNMDKGDGCTTKCKILAGWDCWEYDGDWDSTCERLCGNGDLDKGEDCDDGNEEDDGVCPHDCQFR